MKQMNIVVKIIFPLFFGLFLIASVSIYTNFFFLEKNITKKSSETVDSVSRLLRNIIQQDTNTMLDLLDAVKKDSYTQKLYQEQNREALFSYLEKSFLGYKERYNITHFYFHTLDKKVFLRVHNKNKHSDKIKRLTLSNAAQTQQPSSGIEFGVLHNLTLRVVIPWFIDKKLVGYIELGKEVDKLTPELMKIVDIDLIFTIKKSLINDADFQKWISNLDRNRHYEELENFYVIDSTIRNIGKNLQLHLNKIVGYTKHYITNDDKKYYIHTKPFLDIKREIVGSIHVLIDVTEDFNFIYELIINVSLIVSILIFLMLVYYIRFLKKQERELKTAYLEIQKLSVTDGLTGIYNKRHYLENGPRQLNVCSRCNAYISFILIDVDNFKKYNDRYGHLEGDRALIEITQVMRRVFKRSSDCLYRVGGEEFLIISQSDHEGNNLKMAETLREEVEKLKIEHLENSGFNVLTISIGVCTLKATDKTQQEDLYTKADKALYLSKNNGRNQVTLYS